MRIMADANPEKLVHPAAQVPSAEATWTEFTMEKLMEHMK
jgi:hypothetical protein